MVRRQSRYWEVALPQPSQAPRRTRGELLNKITRSKASQPAPLSVTRRALLRNPELAEEAHGRSKVFPFRDSFIRTRNCVFVLSGGGVGGLVRGITAAEETVERQATSGDTDGNPPITSRRFSNPKARKAPTVPDTRLRHVDTHAAADACGFSPAPSHITQRLLLCCPTLGTPHRKSTFSPF